MGSGRPPNPVPGGSCCHLTTFRQPRAPNPQYLPLISRGCRHLGRGRSSRRPPRNRRFLIQSRVLRRNATNPSNLRSNASENEKPRATSVGSEYVFVQGSDLHSTNALSSDSSEKSTGVTRPPPRAPASMLGLQAIEPAPRGPTRQTWALSTVLVPNAPGQVC